MNALVYRAGWPDRQGAQRVRRVGRWWWRIGPWVLGDVTRWDESGAP